MFSSGHTLCNIFNREQLASWSGSMDDILSFAGYLFNDFRDYEWKVLKLYKNMD